NAISWSTPGGSPVTPTNTYSVDSFCRTITGASSVAWSGDGAGRVGAVRGRPRAPGGSVEGEDDAACGAAGAAGGGDTGGVPCDGGAAGGAVDVGDAHREGLGAGGRAGDVADDDGLGLDVAGE